ncbi:MAG TPA: ComEC/Rec2 family competence protein, partial [Tenuifilaceae bacterium]|nr:ComEC/Rec2 family competence protein [Tenuifilaceae bacterium]
MSLPSSIHEVPFFRLLIPISIGITIQIYFNILPSTPIIAMVSTLLFCSLLISNYVSKQWKYRWIYGILLNTFLIFAGLALAINTSQDKHLVANNENQAIVRLVNSPQERTRSLRVECQLTEIIDNQQYKASHEKILVYFALSDSCAKTLKYGDIVALKLKLREFEKPKNPNQFDIAKYMKQEGIRFSSFVKNGEWILLGNNANPIINYSLKLRDKFISVFRKYFIVDNQLAVLSALTLGYRELLDDEINRVYSSTGAVHILSVSGLHVGILYMFLVFLLSAIPSNRFTELFKLITVLLFLWFFAILTGLSPSVNRSALMFSLVAIGKWYGIRSNIYNTLAIAAFTLLAINPYNIMNIGFQLSFLA